MTSSDAHRIEVKHANHLQAPSEASSAGVLANVYRSANYVVVDIGLPR